MELKHRLLINFIAVVLMALAAFGYVAYEMAGDSAVDAVQATLADSSKLSSELLRQLRDTDPASVVGKVLGSDVSHDGQIAILVKPDGRPAHVIPASLQAWPIGQILAQAQPTGNALYEGRHYVWSSTVLPKTSDRLFTIARVEDPVRSGLSRLASRLFVTGIIIMWVAVWVALIMATMVSRRLNAQTSALQHQATHDSLTDLPNRALLQTRLAETILAADDKRRSVSLVMMDLDRFKEVNDTLGHQVGDLLLKALGERLAKALWDIDTVARLGGDEFALLLPLADSSHTMQVIDKVLKVLAEPFVIDGMTLDVEGSFGIAVYPDDSKNAVELISHAEVAMYQAKQQGERYVRYDRGQDPNSVQRLIRMTDLRHAGTRNELALFYQPKIDLRTQRLAGAEALIRWRHPRHGMVMPDTFIADAEKTGVIKPLSDWVLNEAVRQCAEWNAMGMPLTVAINMSARVIQDLQLPEHVAAVLAQHGVRAEQLDIEITETAIMSDPQRAAQVMTALDVMGVRLSIDDFGTGYTSLAQLKRLPVDEVKIDRSFVMNMLRDANDAMIVHSIIDLAHNMSRTVVAEGVESKKILDALVALNCDVVQGYFFSKPLSVADFQFWFNAASPSPAGLPAASRIARPSA